LLIVLPDTLVERRCRAWMTRPTGALRQARLTQAAASRRRRLRSSWRGCELC